MLKAILKLKIKLEALDRAQQIALALSCLALAVLMWFAFGPRAPDFRDFAVVAERKNAFVAYLCPLIDESNDAARQDRDAVVRGQRAYRESGVVEEQLYVLGEKYGLTLSVEPQVLIERLLRRVGDLPEALVIAQAAIESGWGTSDLFTRANNLFGRRCFYVRDCVDDDAGTRYRAFSSPAESVELYFRDLNTLMPYKRLRDLRAAKVADARRLAEGLTAYSSRGMAYVRQVQLIIDNNELANACHGE